ncbi:MAG: hypothetical protein ACRD43_00440, partial [Pyrinomonadaceae bacterium]
VKYSYSTVPNSPDLAPGKAAIRGTVHWKGVPAAGIKVMLCDTVPSSMLIVDPFAGGGFSCKGQAESVTTDENGAYIFNNLEPAHGATTANSNALNLNRTNANSASNNSPGGDRWRSYIPVAVVEGEPRLYFYWEMSSGSGFPTGDTIYPDPNKTYEIKPINIRKNDLKLNSPINGEKITDRRPALNWEEYPDASSYYVWLAGDSDGNRGNHFDLDSSKPGGKPKADLPNGKYYWTIKANDDHSGEIAENLRNLGTFEVVDQISQPSKVKKK